MCLIAGAVVPAASLRTAQGRINAAAARWHTHVVELEDRLLLGARKWSTYALIADLASTAVTIITAALPMRSAHLCLEHAMRASRCKGGYIHQEWRDFAKTKKDQNP